MDKWNKLTNNEIPENNERVLVAKSKNNIEILSYNGFHKCWDDEDGDDYHADLTEFDYWCKLPTNPLI